MAITIREYTAAPSPDEFIRFGFTWVSDDGRRGWSGDMLIGWSSVVPLEHVREERRKMIMKRVAEIEKDLAPQGAEHQ